MNDFSNLQVNLEPNLAALLGDRLRRTNEATMNKAFTSVADNAERRSLPGESEFDVSGSRLGGGDRAGSETSGMDMLQRVAAATANIPSRHNGMVNPLKNAFGHLSLGDDDGEERDDGDDAGEEDDMRTVTEVREAPRSRFIPERKTNRKRDEYADTSESETGSRVSNSRRKSRTVASRETKKMSFEEESKLKLDLALYLQRISRNMGPEYRLPRAVELSLWDLDRLRHHKRVYKAMYDESESLNMLRNLYVAMGLVFSLPTTLIARKQLNLSNANFVDYMTELHQLYAGSLKGTPRDMPMDPVLLELMAENEFVRQICGKWSRLFYGQIMFASMYTIKLQNERDEQLNKTIAASNAAAEANKNALNEAMARSASSVFDNLNTEFTPAAPPASASYPTATFMTTPSQFGPAPHFTSTSPGEIRTDPFASNVNAETSNADMAGEVEDVTLAEDFSEDGERFAELNGDEEQTERDEELEKSTDSDEAKEADKVDTDDPAGVNEDELSSSEERETKETTNTSIALNEDDKAFSTVPQSVNNGINDTDHLNRVSEGVATSASESTDRKQKVNGGRGRKVKGANIWTIKADDLVEAKPTFTSG